jgi:uroporphyrinogen decarboxylase
MTSLQRVLTTLSHKEPDQVPLFLLLTMHGAKELGMNIREYFSDPRNVAEGQLRLRRKYGHDCLYGFWYAAAELEAWGGNTIFFEDGPPNAGEPVFRNRRQIMSAAAPSIGNSPGLSNILNGISLMKQEIKDEAPIIGVVMSPFSLPVMQLGFDAYFSLMADDKEALDYLLELNIEFCINWANAQLAAGATAICYFDPVSSPTVVSSEWYRAWGLPAGRRAKAGIKGPIAAHLASGRVLSIIDDLVDTGMSVVGVGSIDELPVVKDKCRNRITILGNLNGIAMTRWTPAEAETAVKNAIAQAAPGGGFILSDGHGEIPWQVTDETLSVVASATRRFGKYPLQGFSADDR